MERITINNFDDFSQRVTDQQIDLTYCDIICDINLKEWLLKLGCEKKGLKVLCPYEINARGDMYNNMGIVEFHNTRFIGKCDCTSIIFEKKVDFKYTFFIDETSFKNSEFLNEMYFYYALFKKSADFSEMIASDHTNFSKAVFESSANFEYTFFSQVEFRSTIFRSYTTFMRTLWGHKDSRFDNTYFYDKVLFREILYTNITFDKIKLVDNSQLYFRDVSYEEIQTDFFVSVTNKTLNSQFTIDNIKDGLIKRFPKDYIAITNTIIHGDVNFETDSVKNLNLFGSTIVGSLSRVRFDPICVNWETACILKNQELRKNNVVKATLYQAIEKDLYIQELIGVIKKRIKNCICKYLSPSMQKHFQKIIHASLYVDIILLFALVLVTSYFYQYAILQFLIHNPSILLLVLIICLAHCILFLSPWNRKKNQIQYINYNTDNDDTEMSIAIVDVCMLSLSKMVNDHGRNWIKAAIFTIYIWFICFILFNIPQWMTMKDNTNILVWYDLIQFIYPFNWDFLKLLLDNKNISENFIFQTWIIFWFILGKILTSYGIYEVIKAYRKYK